MKTGWGTAVVNPLQSGAIAKNGSEEHDWDFTATLRENK